MLDEQPQPFDRRNHAIRHQVDNFFLRLNAHQQPALARRKILFLQGIHHFLNTTTHDLPGLLSKSYLNIETKKLAILCSNGP
jgi:hypothetical protein